MLKLVNPTRIPSMSTVLVYKFLIFMQSIVKMNIERRTIFRQVTIFRHLFLI